MKNSGLLTFAVFAILSAAYFYFGLDHEVSSHKPGTVAENPQWQQVVEYAREHLPLEGRLAMTPQGFGYLKVDEGYIHELFPMLGIKEKGFKEPPFYRRSNSPGAHISVFYVNEHVSPRETGQTFHFDLKQITVVKTKNANFVVLQVQSPELERLREKYGLSPKLFGHDFHISIGEKQYSRNRH